MRVGVQGSHHIDFLRSNFGFIILLRFFIELTTTLPSGEWFSQRNFYIHENYWLLVPEKCFSTTKSCWKSFSSIMGKWNNCFWILCNFEDIRFQSIQFKSYHYNFKCSRCTSRMITYAFTKGWNKLLSVMNRMISLKFHWTLLLTLYTYGQFYFYFYFIEVISLRMMGLSTKYPCKLMSFPLCDFFSSEYALKLLVWSW